MHILEKQKKKNELDIKACNKSKLNVSPDLMTKHLPNLYKAVFHHRRPFIQNNKNDYHPQIQQSLLELVLPPAFSLFRQF